MTDPGSMFTPPSSYFLLLPRLYLFPVMVVGTVETIVVVVVMELTVTVVVVVVVA